MCSTELNLSRVGMNDFDVAKEDNEGRVQLDPSVWANPFKPMPTNDMAPFIGGGGGFQQQRNPDPAFLRQHFPNPFAAASSSGGGGEISQQLLNQHHQQMLQQQQQQQQMFLLQQQQHQQQQMQMMETINKQMVNIC